MPANKIPFFLINFVKNSFDKFNVRNSIRGIQTNNKHAKAHNNAKNNLIIKFNNLKHA